MIQIVNNELIELDKKVGDFYKLSARYFGSLINLHGRQVYKDGLTALLRAAEGIKPEGQFDELILRNIQSNLSLNDMTIDYFTDPNFSLTVKDFFDKLCGKGSFEYLEERVNSPPWEERWKSIERDQERDYLKIHSSTVEAQESAIQWLPKIKQDIINFGKTRGYLPNDFEMSLMLIPSHSSNGTSSWNPQTKVFNLGAHCFDFFSDENKGIKAVPTEAYHTAFHEVLGHAAHQVYSEKMPLSLQFTEQIGFITPTKTITEGVAINAEQQSYDFLRERLNDLGIGNEDIFYLEKERNLQQQTRMEYMYYALTSDRAKREKGFDSYEHLIQLTQNPVLTRNVLDNFEKGFIDSWRTLGHTMGPLHYQKMVDGIKNEFGAEKINSKEFQRAALSGVWSHEIYPEAVSYMLK